jgi:hypothetical protein
MHLDGLKTVLVGAKSVLVVGVIHNLLAVDVHTELLRVLALDTLSAALVASLY